MAAESLDLDDGSSSGWTVYWDLHGIERHSVWEEVLTDQIRHRLAWDAYAISYDRVLLEMPYYHEVITRHIDAMKKESIETVLDIGAGTGNVTVPLLQSGRSVTAVDVSRAMLSKLRSKIRGIVSPRLKILEQNAEQMHQLDSDSYDGVSILLALYDMSYPERALAEAVRLLRPGGAIVITEPKVDFDLHVILDHCWERLRERTLERELGDDMKRVYEVNEELDPESRDSGSPMRAEIVAAWLRELNFEEVTLQESHFRQCATIRAKKPLAYTAR